MSWALTCCGKSGLSDPRRRHPRKSALRNMPWIIEKVQSLNDFRSRSGQELADDVAFDVGEPEVAAGVTEGQLQVIQAQQVQDRRVQVVDVDLVLGREEAVVVGA